MCVRRFIPLDRHAHTHARAPSHDGQMSALGGNICGWCIGIYTCGLNDGVSQQIARSVSVCRLGSVHLREAATSPSLITSYSVYMQSVKHRKLLFQGPLKDENKAGAPISLLRDVLVLLSPSATFSTSECDKHLPRAMTPAESGYWRDNASQCCASCFLRVYGFSSGSANDVCWVFWESYYMEIWR